MPAGRGQAEPLLNVSVLLPNAGGQILPEGNTENLLLARGKEGRPLQSFAAFLSLPLVSRNTHTDTQTKNQTEQWTRLQGNTRNASARERSKSHETLRKVTAPRGGPTKRLRIK